MAAPEHQAAAEADATSPQTGHLLAEALKTGEVTVPGYDLHGADVAVELIGHGESYAAWLVRTSQAQLLFRFPRRTPREMPTTIAAEFAALRRVPQHLGTRGLAMDDTTENALRRRYVVTTYVPGRVIDGAGWTPGMLRVHTAQLAALHDATHDPQGAAGRSPRDLAAELSADFEGWCASPPQVAAASTAGQLVATVVTFLQRRQWAFQQVDSDVLIHGDAVATNVVFDEQGTARYIDWEWAHIGDIAQDLAYVGGQVHGGPWYVPMTEAQVGEQVWQYLRARSSVEATERAFEALLARRQSWEVYERFMSSLHFERVHQSSPANARYGPWVGTQRETLVQLLKRSDA